MKLRDSTAFILQSYPLHEADKICVCFTQNFGKVRGVARGAKRMRSRFGASLEPLSEVHLIYHENEGRELVSIRSCELIRTLFDVGVVPEGEALIHYFIELIDCFCPPHEPNDKIYRLVKAITECLNGPNEKWARHVIYFEVWLLKLSGFFPQLDQCARCGQDIPGHVPIALTFQGRPECLPCRKNGPGVILAPPIRREVRNLLSEPPSRWGERGDDLEPLRPFVRFLRGLLRDILETEIKTERFVKV